MGIVAHGAPCKWRSYVFVDHLHGGVAVAGCAALGQRYRAESAIFDFMTCATP